jgi:hypothetical protein
LRPSPARGVTDFTTVPWTTIPVQTVTFRAAKDGLVLADHIDVGELCYGRSVSVRPLAKDKDSMRKAVLVASILTALATSLSPGSPASAAVVDPPPTGNVLIDIVAMSGSGCLAGSTQVEVSPDNATFRLWSDNFRVQIGPHAAPIDARKNCQVSLSIQVPPGFVYAIDRVEYGGYAALAPGAIFTQRARYYRTGQVPEQPLRTHSWTGPYENEWQAVDTFSVDDLYFPPCGTNPNFNAVFAIRLDVGSSDPATQTSFAALDSVDGPYGALYRLQTKSC